jgi:DNA segregation ATPase FtsK/SpoIIIE, S-DNA-T family
MIQKILKIQLFSFFALTVISFASFYFYDVLPDNFYSISSSTGYVSTLSYLFFSLVASAGFYIGPWIFLPFLITALSYGLIYGHRESGWDSFAGPSVFVFSGVAVYYLSPSFMGMGLKYVLNIYATDFSLITTAVIGLFIFCYLTFQRSFIKSLTGFFEAMVMMPSWAWKKISTLNLGTNLKKSFLSIWNAPDKFIAYIQALKNKTQTVDPQVKPKLKPTRVEKKSLPSNETSIISSEDFIDEEATDLDWSSDGVVSAEKKNRTNVIQRDPQDDRYVELMDYFSNKAPGSQVDQPDEDYFARVIERIEGKLEEFNIQAKIINILKGPVVDTYELELGPGIKISRVTGLQEDISMALEGAPIRIVYPMKQRTTAGIEVPRNPREVIYLHEVLQSAEFSNSSFRLPVAMGRDAFGETFVVDLASMPHMLVAGATGAGKSVFINTLLMSLLVKKSPKQMRLILIDPKQLELALYSELPHLLMPVLTEPNKSAVALLWAIQEMDRRYTILKEATVRDIESFNKKVARAEPALLSKLHPFYENDPDEKGYELPYVVIVVDEFADLIKTKMGKDIETAICRLAAKARAAGIHLVLATQRPSVDVVTGLIKSNFPVRVSFRVTTSTDSRTILDQMGAERLLGKGDMLYKHGVDSSRVHAAFVEESEIESLVGRLSDFSGTYDDGAMNFLENNGNDGMAEYGDVTISFGGSQNTGSDELFSTAVKLVVENRAASASMLQRRLGIGYPRAANLIDELERKGIIGPAQGSKPRQVISAEPTA